MKIIIPKKLTKKIFNQVKKGKLNETKGALFARKISDDIFEVDDVYIESKVGSFAFVELVNNKKYQVYQKSYHKKNGYDYVNHNYIGDWHSHPSFELYPSSYDMAEVKSDLKKSNAKFLVQVIVKIVNKKLTGNAFYYDRKNSAKQIELLIEQ